MAAAVAGSEHFSHASRAIVFRNGNLLIVERNKFGRRYRTLVGGRVEPGETFEQALIREVAEETTMTVKNPKHVFDEIVPEFSVIQHIFLCEYVSGEPKLDLSSEEYEIGLAGENTYLPMWMPFEKILSESGSFPFVTPRLLEEINNAYNSSFPTSVKEWTH